MNHIEFFFIENLDTKFDKIFYTCQHDRLIVVSKKVMLVEGPR